jgi:hypothetical protein
VSAHFTENVFVDIKNCLGAPSLIVRLEEDGRFSLFWKVGRAEYSAIGESLGEVLLKSAELGGRSLDFESRRSLSNSPVDRFFTANLLKEFLTCVGAPSLIVRLEEDGRYSLFWKVDGVEYSAIGDTLAQAFAAALELVGK